ncbi:hypothetical protein [Lyngbya aestuarii]|uniref:hypothetical protein n=1 Tax=Lyngbya aestuarii TaxID=118322 RepID=UPI00403DF33C
MSEQLGPIAFERMQQQFLESVTNPRRPVSPKIAEEIDREVKLLVARAHHIALAILDKNRQLLEETAQALLDKEILEGQELRERLKLVQKTEQMEEWLSKGSSPQDALLLQTTFNGGQPAKTSRYGTSLSEKKMLDS